MLFLFNNGFYHVSTKFVQEIIYMNMTLHHPRYTREDKQLMGRNDQLSLLDT